MSDFARIADELKEMFAEQLTLRTEDEDIMKRQGKVITELSDKIIKAKKILEDMSPTPNLIMDMYELKDVENLIDRLLEALK
jgi:hypothetical protein